MIALLATISPLAWPFGCALAANERQEYLGAGSCAAAACHNGHVAKGQKGSEHAFWITRDAHARAYEVLFNERSTRIQQTLRSKTPATDDVRCLKCHVAPAFNLPSPPRERGAGGEGAPPYFKTDGVSCESCHGPAKNWLTIHHLDEWRRMSAAEKQRRGMNDTKTLAGRAQVCATCHVGAAGMDVDHDLIAAGHPRLHFEFSAFHAAMPHHWPRSPQVSAANLRDRPDFENRAWVIGQITTAVADLELLAERSGNRLNPWPEFAAFDCAACHHSLKFDSPRQKAGFGPRKAGTLPWGGHAALTTISLEILGNDAEMFRSHVQIVRKLLDAGDLQREKIASAARKAAASGRVLLVNLDQKLPAARQLHEQMQRSLSARAALTNTTADEATQLQLLHAALRRSAFDLRLPMPANLPTSLRDRSFPQFDPQSLHRRLAESITLQSRKGS